MSDLTDWLTAQIEADEAAARAADGPHWRPGDGNISEGGLYALDGDGSNEAGWAIAWFELGWANRRDDGTKQLPAFSQLERHAHQNSIHAARWDPARALAECAAKRDMIAQCRAMIATGERADGGADQYAHGILHLLAAPYTDRPGYRPEWAALHSRAVS